MPADSNKSTNSRRPRKSVTEDEVHDIEQKRLRGELSCAECRRLKLKCDKKLPCSSCERRGCESICPLGVLAAGQGTRYVLADTEQLHVKIYEMSNRIRQLEDALAFLQSTVSDEPHPLLTEVMLRVKFGSEVLNAPQVASSLTSSGGAVDSGSGSAAAERSIDALGTLTLGSSGDVHYFGRSAGSEALMLKAGDDAEDIEDENQTTSEVDELRPCLPAFPFQFPFSSKSELDLHSLEVVEKCLPLQSRASQLCNRYLDHAAYFFRPIKADELLEELLPAVYNSVVQDSSTNRVEGAAHCAQSLATLLFVFALGALLDLTLPPYGVDAERFYELGRASLSLHPVYESPSLESVRAVGLMATYHSFAGKKYTRDSAWSLMSIAAKVAQSIGLHRDSSKWNMDSKLVQRRRNLFWEVFSADLSHSLALGRPPAIHPSYVDCEFPQDDDACSEVMGLWRMKHMFARDVYSSVAEITLVAKSPSYTAILDLDKKVKGMSCPKSFNAFVSVEEVGEEMFHSSSLSLRDFYASQNRTVTMLYLHRSFFAQTMLDHPDNPLMSPFALSFLAASRAASIIIEAAEILFKRCTPIATRVWFLMYHMLSAAVILGTIVTRSPTSNSAPTAMRDFNIAFDIFTEAAGHSQRAKIALGILQKLRDRARLAFETIQNNVSSKHSGSSDVLGEEDDIVAIFGGQMSVLDRRAKLGQQKASSSSSPSHTRSSNKTPSPANVEMDLAIDGALPDVHPSLIEYLNQDAVRKALQQEPHDTTIKAHHPISSTHLAGNHIVSASTSQVNSANHQLQGVATMPNPSESQSLSYLKQPSTLRTHRQPNPYRTPQSDDENSGNSGLLPTLHVDTTTDTIHPTHASAVLGCLDYSRDPGLAPSAFDAPDMAEVGPPSRTFNNVDWYSFMRDCGIMDIEDG